MILKYGKEKKLVRLLDFYRCEQNRYSNLNIFITIIQEDSRDQYKSIVDRFEELKVLFANCYYLTARFQ